MRKVLVTSVLIISVVFALKAPLSYAASTPDHDEKKDEIQARFETRKQLIQERKDQIKLRITQKRATRQAQLTERKRNRVKLHYEKLIKRFQFTIIRLETLVERIESRILKLSQEEDVDTSEIEQQLTVVKGLLIEANVDLQAASDSMDEVLSANNPKVAFEVIKDTIINLKTKLKEVHNILVHTIGGVKGLRVRPGSNTQTIN